MANSSDWIDQIGGVERKQPDWVAALSAREGFQPGAPFAAAQQAMPDEGRPAVQADNPPKDEIARAYADGEAAGRAAAEAEAEAEQKRQRDLRLAFRAFDQAALDSLAAELAETVVGLCGQVLESSAVDRESLIARCEAAAKRIGEAANECTLRLHPDDIALLGDTTPAGLTLEADAALERGSLLLEGPDGAVRDGPAEWRRAIADAVRG